MNDFFSSLAAGGFALKKQLLDDRRFPKMHLDLQRLLQVVLHSCQSDMNGKERSSYSPCLHLPSLIICFQLKKALDLVITKKRSTLS